MYWLYIMALCAYDSVVLRACFAYSLCTGSACSLHVLAQRIGFVYWVCVLALLIGSVHCGSVYRLSALDLRIASVYL